MKKSKKKTGVIIVILIIIAVLLVCGFMLWKNKKPEYETDSVEIGDINSFVTVKGTVRAAEESKVYSDSTCKIAEIPVKRGDKVKKGQVLARLDIDKLKQQYEIANIDLESAKTYYENTVTLFKSGSIPQNTLDEAERAMEKAELLCKTYDIENAGEIISPIDGIVTEINCTEGGYASLSIIQQAAFVIEDRSQLEFKAEAKEKYLPSIHLGQEAIITSNSMGDIVATGIVTDIAPSGRVNESNGGVIIPVTIAIDNPSGKWMTGVSGKAKLQTSVKEVLTVSLDAISEKNDETSIYVLKNDGSIDKITIETGITDGERIQVTADGICEGDRVILDPDAYEF